MSSINGAWGYPHHPDRETIYLMRKANVHELRVLGQKIWDYPVGSIEREQLCNMVAGRYQQIWGRFRTSPYEVAQAKKRSKVRSGELEEAVLL